MALILTECLQCNLVSYEGILRQPELDRLVLIVCEAVTRINHFFKVLGIY